MWFQGGYETLVRKCPSAWGHLYRSSDRKRFNYRFQTALDLAYCAPIERLISEFNPDWVLCTHSLPQPRLAKLREKYGFRIAIVITDLHPHLVWLRGEPDFFFVPTESSRAELEQRYPASRGVTEIVGIPVAPYFSPSDIEPTRVLISAGGIGGGPVRDVAAALRHLPAKVTVVCGRNASLFEELSTWTDIDALGQVPQAQMADLIRESHFIVGKPGGLTTFESLACGVPLVMFEPLIIPGQEEDNAAFLEQVGAGIRVSRLDRLEPTCHELLENSPKLELLRRAARQNGIPDAATLVLNRLIALSASTS